MPTAQIVSKALHDANDALLGVHYITRITRPNFHCFSDVALERSPRPSSGFALSRGFAQRPPHPLNSLRSPQKLKPCLSAGFREIYSTYIHK